MIYKGIKTVGSIIKFCFITSIVCLGINTNAQETDLFLLMGQSNMSGHPEIEVDTLKLEEVYLLSASGEFIPAENPLNEHSTITGDRLLGQRLSPAYSFSKKMGGFLKDSVRIIVQARGGTPIEKFMKGSNWGYYEATRNRVKNALEKYPDSRLRAVIVHQGESNRKRPETYLSDLHQVVADLRADLNMPNLPFIFGELGQWNPDYEEIRKEMKKIPDVIPLSYLVSSKNLSNDDKHHFDMKSVIELGTRYADKCIEVFYNNN